MAVCWLTDRRPPPQCRGRDGEGVHCSIGWVEILLPELVLQIGIEPRAQEQGGVECRGARVRNLWKGKQGEVDPSIVIYCFLTNGFKVHVEKCMRG